MENYLPNNVNDTNRFTHAWNKILDWCRRNTLYSSSDIFVNQTMHGITLTLANKSSVNSRVGSSNNTVNTVSGIVFRGLWNSLNVYSKNDCVIMQSGVAKGSYISLIDLNSNDPATGVGWIQFPQSSTVGAWT